LLFKNEQPRAEQRQVDEYMAQFKLD